MAELFHKDDTVQKIYWDRRFYPSIEEQIAALKGSSIVYVGNLNPKSSEQQIHETFSRVGPIRKIIMGMNQQTKEPCGFCFVDYYSSEHAQSCLKFISGSFCFDRIIRCELDGGFKPGRQYGRGASGGQAKNEKITIRYETGQKRGRDSWGSDGGSIRRQSFGSDHQGTPGRSVTLDYDHINRQTQQRRRDPLTDGLSAPRTIARNSSPDDAPQIPDGSTGSKPADTEKVDEVEKDSDERPFKNARFRSDKDADEDENRNENDD